MRNRMRPVGIPAGRLVLSRPTMGLYVWGWPRETNVSLFDIMEVSLYIIH